MTQCGYLCVYSLIKYSHNDKRENSDLSANQLCFTLGLIVILMNPSGLNPFIVDSIVRLFKVLFCSNNKFSLISHNGKGLTGGEYLSLSLSV